MCDCIEEEEYELEAERVVKETPVMVAPLVVGRRRAKAS